MTQLTILLTGVTGLVLWLWFLGAWAYHRWVATTRDQVLLSRYVGLLVAGPALGHLVLSATTPGHGTGWVLLSVTATLVWVPQALSLLPAPGPHDPAEHDNGRRPWPRPQLVRVEAPVDTSGRAS